ncbi:MAG: stalk domain-containing protein [Oscillospiraceae bacterium]|nr:stalk domain-containing protein [Oscillospiraceae bacterium]
MKTKFKVFKGFVMGVLVTVLLTSTFALANPVTRELIFGVNVTINGATLELAEDSRAFTMDGRTFLPLRALSEALDLEINWDPATRTANVATAQPVTLPAQIEIVPITWAEIQAIQVAWGEGLVAISTAYADGEDYAAIAQGVLDTLYGYVDGPVLFKPTVASEVPFRFTEAAAASYFIGGSISEDTGFALLPWTAVRFGTDGQHIINGETALWMGSVYLTNGDGEVTRVEKSMGFYRDSEGDLRIQLHHSSVPFESED